jgi:hypothetical protein
MVKTGMRLSHLSIVLVTKAAVPQTNTNELKAQIDETVYRLTEQDIKIIEGVS